MLPVRRRSARARRASHLRAARAGERRAAIYYFIRGYKILGMNVRVGRSEIDLIVRRGSNVVFCEVKTRSRLDFGDPVEMVDAEQRRRLRRAAAAWLAAQPRMSRFDVSFEILGMHGRRIRRIRRAF